MKRTIFLFCNFLIALCCNRTNVNIIPSTIISNINTPFTSIQCGISKGDLCAPGGVASVIKSLVVDGTDPYTDYIFYANSYKRISTINDFVDLFNTSIFNIKVLLTASSYSFITATGNLPDYCNGDNKFASLSYTANDTNNNNLYVNYSISVGCASILFASNELCDNYCYYFFLSCNNGTAYDLSLSYYRSNNIDSLQLPISYEDVNFYILKDTSDSIRCNANFYLLLLFAFAILV